MFVQSWKGLRMRQFQHRSKCSRSIHPLRWSSRWLGLQWLVPQHHRPPRWQIFSEALWPPWTSIWHISGLGVLPLPLPVIFTCLLCSMFSKVFATTSISCFWMTHWSVITLRNTHCYPLFWDKEIRGRKWPLAGSIWCWKVEAGCLSEQLADEPAEPWRRLAVPLCSLPPLHLLLSGVQVTHRLPQFLLSVPSL